VSGIDAATLREQGVNVELANWRSVVAPPGISAADRERLADAMLTMVTSEEWQSVLARYRWIDSPLTGRDLDAFIEAEQARVGAILQKLGTRSGAATTRAAASGYPLLVIGGLLLTGLAAAGGLRRSRTRETTTVATTGGRHRTRTAALIGSGLLLYLVLLERAGFVIASAILFWCIARSFDDRHPLRDAALGLAIAVLSYVLFARGLQLTLPAGIFGLLR
jgi:hypothetical protein